MAEKIAARDGGETSEEGISRMSSRLISAAGVFATADLQVTATGTPDNHVNVGTGDIAIGNNSPNTADPDYYYHGWNTASYPLTISSNGSGNPRIDLVVAYVDLSVVDDSNPDNPGALAFKTVEGTAGATPVAPDDTAIQASVGSGNPWVLLAQVAVANGFSSIANSDITDLRAKASTVARLTDKVAIDFVGTGLLWSQLSGLIGQLTTGYAFIDGETVNKGYLSHTFTASKDTYVDLPKGSTPTQADDLTYTEKTPAATAPALASGSIRLAVVTTDGSGITGVVTSGDDNIGTPIHVTSPVYTHTHANNTNGGLLTNSAFATSVAPVQRYADNFYDHVVNGTDCVWTADAAASTRVASMSAGVVYIGGVRLTVAAVVSRTFTASKDVYVGLIDAGDGTATVVYYDNTTNAASPSLVTAGYTMLIAIIVVGASSIAAATSINQGEETMVLPIASSVPYTVTDSLGNLICPRDPNRKLLGYRQIITTFNTTSTSPIQVTGLTVPFLPLIRRKLKIEFHAGASSSSSGTSEATLDIWEGIVGSGTLLDRGKSTASGPGYPFSVTAKAFKTYLADTIITINGGFSVNTGGQTLAGNVSAPIFISIEVA